MFLDIPAAFDSLDGSALWHCLLRSVVPEKCVSVLEELYCHASDRVRAYGQISLAIEVPRYDMSFAPPKCKLFLQHWQDSVPALTLCGDQLEVFTSFK